MKRIFLSGISVIALVVMSLLLVAEPFSQPVKAAGESIYYVAPDGDDSNPGTEEQPWRTIQKAADTMTAGDTVYIKEGTYNEQVKPANSGSSGNIITYAVYPAHTTIISWNGGTAYEGVFESSGKSYITLSGLQVQDSNGYGVNIGGVCSNWILEDLYVLDCQGSGIRCGRNGYPGDMNHLTIDNCEVTNCCQNNDEESLNLNSVHYFEIKDCYVHDTGKEGINAGNGSSYGSIHDCEVDNSARCGIYLGAYQHDMDDVDCYNNLVHDVGRQGIGLSIESGGTIDTCNVYNNLVYNVGDWYGCIVGFDYAGPKDNVSIYNNTVYGGSGNTLGIMIHWTDGDVTNLIIRNNAITYCGSTGVYFEHAISSLTHEYNLYYNNNSNGTVGDNPVYGDPSFVNAPTDMHIQSDSAAKDPGSINGAPSDDYDGVSRPQGAGYDIGAYEYAAAPSALVAEFNASPTSGNKPLSVQFTDESTGQVISWLWDFGDGTTSEEQNPPHTYSEAGSYTVSLTVTSSVGSDAETKADYITVGNPAVAGDANGDGQVNTADITMLERIVAGLEGATPGADANGDGQVNTADITQIERIIAGLS